MRYMIYPHCGVQLLTRHSVKSSIFVSASGHQSNTSSMKGIPELEMADVLPATTTPADSGWPGGVGFTKARMTINEWWTQFFLISVI